MSTMKMTTTVDTDMAQKLDDASKARPVTGGAWGRKITQARKGERSHQGDAL